jgi:HSP20 family protein
MEEIQESPKKTNILYGVIAALALILILETGFLLAQIRSTKETKAEVTRRSFDSLDPQPLGKVRPTQSYRRSKQGFTPPSSSFAQDPFASEDPFSALEQIQQRMNRMFETALSYGPSLANTFSDLAGSDFMPAIDLKETDKTYIVTGDLPGLEKDKINITVTGNFLTIQGVRELQSTTQDDKQGFYSQERRYGSFARTITLPGPIDESKIAADYKNGVLTITLPKVEAGKNSQRIAVQ